MSLLDGIPLRTLTKRKGPYSFSCMGLIRLRSGRQGTLSPWTPCDFFVKKSSKNSTTPAGGTKGTVQLCGAGNLWDNLQRTGTRLLPVFVFFCVRFRTYGYAI